MSGGFRMNFLSIASSIISLVSIFEPWWGVAISSPIVSTSYFWGPTSQPSNTPGAGVNAAFSQALATYTPIILILVLFSIVMGLLGSFSAHRLLLATSLIASIGALIGYLGLISYALTLNCQGNGCIRQLTGSQTVFSFTTSWGLQAGFYIFLVGSVITIGAIAFHRGFTRMTV